ncbi:MAG: hypothetical protein IAG13_35270, partial [Deltaproteobacteria bacterium]|nr:hypothetical protein [Nannocystaceae bacterium]
MSVSLFVSILLSAPALALPQAPPLPLLEDAPLWEMPADAAFPLPVYPFVPSTFYEIGQEYSYVTDDWAHLLAPGDVDGDGFADLIVEIQHEEDFSFASGDMRLYLGGKAGLADAPATERIGLTGEVRPVGDIDDDGHADVLVCSQDACDVYLGESTGLAETPVRTITIDDLGVVNDSHYLYGAVGNADFDGDGIGDFALFDTSDALAVVFGATDTAEFRFAARDDFTTLWALGTVPDIDDDGDDELVVFTTFYDFENEQQTELQVLSVSDDAQSIEDHSAVDLELGGGAHAELRATDFDGDGQAELIYADAWDDWGNGIVKVYGWGGDAWDLDIELDGTGLVDYPSIRCFGRRITTGDLDGDGISDLAVGSRAFLDLLVGGAGGLQPFATDVLQAVIIPDDENVLMGDVALELSALGDVDGDGDDDLAAFGYDFVDGEHFPFVRLHAGGAAGCADDADHDGVCDDDDNCPTFNPAQEDEDDNGVGNACDFPGSDSSGGEETSSSGGPSAESSSAGGGDETTGSTSGHADGSSSETNAGATLGDDDHGSSSDTGGTAGMNAGDGGCGCHSSGSGTPLGVLLLVVACVVRRRARLQTWVLAASAGGCNDPSSADPPVASSTGSSSADASSASDPSSSGGIAGGMCCAADGRS